MFLTYAGLKNVPRDKDASNLLLEALSEQEINSIDDIYLNNNLILEAELSCYQAHSGVTPFEDTLPSDSLFLRAAEVMRVMTTWHWNLISSRKNDMYTCMEAMQTSLHFLL